MGMNSAPKPRPTMAVRIFRGAEVDEVIAGFLG
jgi:uncharacterized protein YqiB (DUF1249 family)